MDDAQEGGKFRLIGDGMYNPDMLKMALGIRGVSVRQLADQTSLRTRAIYGFLANETPDKETLKKVAEALQFPVNFFTRPGELLERDPRYPLDMYVGLPKRPPPTREQLAELLPLIPDHELPALFSYMHEVAQYPENVKRLTGK